MQTEVTLPELGENIKSAKVLDVLVSAGQEVSKDQSLLTLESDKAEFDLPSPVAGKVSEVLVQRGDDVRVGQVILRLTRDGAAAGADGGVESSVPPPRPVAASAAAASQAREHGTPGPAREGGLAHDDRSQQFETRRAEDVRLGKAQPELKPGGERGQGQPEVVPHETKRAEVPEPRAERGVPAGPAVRRLARELGIALSSVPVAAPDGRVTPEDVYRYVRARLQQPGREGGDAGEHVPAAERDYSRWGEATSEPMTTVRRRTAEQMSLAWSSIPHVTHYDAADITELERLRRQFAPRVESAGGKLTITAILLKVLGSALRRFPKFNASVDMESSAIVYKHFVNVGVAVDTERGLLVPVLRDVDRKNIRELALELHRLSEAARTRKVRPEMLQGSTFTLTNLGGIGGRAFSPLINPPEVAVLGVSRSTQEPVWADGHFDPHLMLPLSLTYDHRVIDGADAARFLRWVCEALAEPFLMDLEGE